MPGPSSSSAGSIARPVGRGRGRGDGQGQRGGRDAVDRADDGDGDEGVAADGQRCQGRELERPGGVGGAGGDLDGPAGGLVEDLDDGAGGSPAGEGGPVEGGRPGLPAACWAAAMASPWAPGEDAEGERRCGRARLVWTSRCRWP